MFPHTVRPEFAENFVNSINELGLYQVKNISNSMNRFLDLLFTNDPSNMEISKPCFASPIVNIDMLHPPILITYEWHFSENSSNEISTSHNFTKGDYTKCNEFLSNSNLINKLIDRYLSLHTMDE